MKSTTALEPALRDLVRQALQDLGALAAGEESNLFLEIPRARSHGDLALSAAMQLAAKLHKPPLQIAQSLADRLNLLLKESPLHDSIEKVEVKPPGFINFFLSRPFLYQVLQEVLKSGGDYGRSSMGAGRKAMGEFVSANPTGPLSVAHGRQAAVGDALANLLDFAGYRVHREYYLNDEGTQIDLLGASVLARAREAAGFPAQFPENGYKGSYIADL